MPNNNNHNPPPPPPPPHVDMLTRFLRLRPEKFSRAAEPMVANDWLRSVNKDLVTIGCTDAEKVRFAAHLLEGPAASWWENFQITHPIEEVTWAIFEDGFRTAHISSGVMDLKRTEFLNLRQGHRSVSEYIEEFSKLVRYAPDDSNTDAKRKERFLKGLNDELMVQLSVVYVPTYQSLCDKAITLENTVKQVEKRKRKHSYDKHGSGPPHKMRSYGEGSGGSRYHKYGNNDGGSKHQHHNGNGHHHNGHKSYHHPNSGKGNRSHNGINNGHNHNNGHRSGKRDISQDAEEVKKAEETRKPNPFRKGYVNHVNVEELYDEPDAVIGTFLLNNFSALVLFDTGASHSFISRAFVDKNKLPTETIGSPLRVSSPGGEMLVSAGCKQLTLDIGKYKFPVDLIILESQGLDVILGMDWMTAYRGIIDCTKKTVALTTPEKKRIHFKSTFELKGSNVNSLKGVSLEDIPIVREYPDVFLEELPRLPPDTDVEFLIELMPGTGPIAKRPYKMDVDELKELKKQIKEQFEKGFI
ncbi:uncharacterized protein [Lolium perenne]|uniref:uncharacterized protein n=1 Tax=Lolium perenne TaxID=4522 RepID=UPI0021F5A351|nr:uncharacterized protein LOC127348176 [Lolium perenne]